MLNFKIMLHVLYVYYYVARIPTCEKEGSGIVLTREPERVE